MASFDPNRQECYSREELLALHKQAEITSRTLLSSLDLPGALSHINTMEQIRARFVQDCKAQFPQSLYTTLRSN